MRSAAMAVEAGRQIHEDNLELRDRLVLEGIDGGRQVRDVASTALISQARVHQVIAKIG